MGSSNRLPDISVQRLPSRLGDPHPCDLDLARARNDALGGRRRQPGVHKVDHQRDGEAVRAHDRFGHALGRVGEQFERAAVVVITSGFAVGGHGTKAVKLSEYAADGLSEWRAERSPKGLKRLVGAPGLAPGARWFI